MGSKVSIIRSFVSNNNYVVTWIYVISIFLHHQEITEKYFSCDEFLKTFYNKLEYPTETFATLKSLIDFSRKENLNWRHIFKTLQWRAFSIWIRTKRTKFLISTNAVTTQECMVLPLAKLYNLVEIPKIPIFLWHQYVDEALLASIYDKYAIALSKLFRFCFSPYSTKKSCLFKKPFPGMKRHFCSLNFRLITSYKMCR